MRPPIVDTTAPRGTVSRVWALPLRAHVAALTLILLALVPVVGTSSSFSTDEGAAILQAKSLARGDGWVVEHPVPEVDPDGRHYPLEMSEWGPDGIVPFGKHPVYVLLLTGADRLGGVTAMVLLSLAGTVGAAALAAALARRLADGLARSALWVVGLASPLLFDGFLVMGHTIGAAASVAAVLAAVVALERGSRNLAIAVAPLVAAAVLVRKEAAFVALGLAVVAGMLAILRRRERSTAAVVALGSALGGAAAYLFDAWWLARLTGGHARSARVVPATADSYGFLTGRWRGFLRTVLTPAYGGDRITILLFAMVAALAVAALSMRRLPGRRGPVLGGAAVAVVAAVAAVVVEPRTVVPGLLIAFPLATVGLLLVRRTTLASPAARIPFGVFTVFALCVVASQYAVGGATEWGGRFFAIGLPMVAPVLLLAVKQQGARVDRHVRRVATAALVVCSLATATLAVSSLRHQHRRLGQLVAMADEAGRSSTSPGERPVMVATFASVPRWAWRTFDGQRWLSTDPQDLPELLDRLGRAGVSRIGLVTPNLARDKALLGERTVVSSAASELAQGWHVLVVAIS